MRISELSIRRPVFATVISLLLIIFGLVSPRPPVRCASIRTSTARSSPSRPTIAARPRAGHREQGHAGHRGPHRRPRRHPQDPVSQSLDERSNINVEFDVSRDVDSAANDIRDRVSRVLEPAARGSGSAGDREGGRERRSGDVPQLQRGQHDRRWSSRTTPSATSSTGSRRCRAWRVWRSTAGAATRCASGSIARRSPRAHLTVADIESALAARERAAARRPPRIAHARVLAAHRSRTRQRGGLPRAGHRTRRGRSSRAARRSGGRAARGRGRAQHRRARTAVPASARHRSAIARPTRSMSREACARKSQRMQPTLPKGMTARHQRRQRRVHRGGAARSGHRARIRVRVRAARHLRVPRQSARHADSGGHDSGVDHRLVHRDVRARLHDQRAHAARPGARDRPGGRRRHRGAGEHPSAHASRASRPWSRPSTAATRSASPSSPPR